MLCEGPYRRTAKNCRTGWKSVAHCGVMRPAHSNEDRSVDLSDPGVTGVQVLRVMMRQFSQTNGYCQVS